MNAGPSQDPEIRAQAQAEWRALRMIRPAAALVILAAVAVVGMVWLATGHYRSGLITLAIIGVLTVPTIAGQILRRRHSGG
jgi:glycine/D-amino acid oxidase-like deaminating enzyme